MQVGRGDIWHVDELAGKPRNVLVVSRDVAIPVLREIVVVLVTSTIRGHLAEVSLGPGHGLDHECVANCDQIFTIGKHRLSRYRGRLAAAELVRLDEALRYALGIEW